MLRDSGKFILTSQDTYLYDLDKISEIHLNSVPMFYGGVSGKIAQKYNWEFIKQHKELPIAGSSWLCMDDIKYLFDLGCQNFGIGSVLFFNRKLLAKLKGNI